MNQNCERCGNGKDKYSYWDKICSRCAVIEKVHQDEIAEGERLKSKAKQLDNHYRNKYGISLMIYNEMLDSQDGKCDICDRDQSEFNHRLYVDHCHATGKVRSLLCNGCNSLVGIIENGNVRDAMDYIEKHRPTE